jgi:methionyl-tRNA synthetase
MRVAEPFYIPPRSATPTAPAYRPRLRAIAADVIARHKRAQGSSLLQTGTDEHGLKMSQAARDRGVEPQALADEMSALFRDMADGWTSATTASSGPPTRTPPCQPGDLGSHGGAGRHLSRPLRRLVLGPRRGILRREGTDGGRGRAPVAAGHCGRVDGGGKLVLPPSAYAQPLLEHIEANPDFIRPRRAATKCWASSAAAVRPVDLAHSFDWGVRVPGRTTTSCTSGSTR